MPNVSHKTSYTLHPKTAFGALEPRTETIGKVTLAEQSHLALASLTKRREGKLPKSVRGVPLAAIGGAEFKQGLTSIWMGPDQWMLAGDYETYAPLDSMIKNSVKSAASVTEQTDAWVVIDISGEGLERYFELLCAADIEKMMSGSASRVSIEHVSALLVCKTAGTQYWLLGARSSAESLWHRLQAAAYAIA